MSFCHRVASVVRRLSTIHKKCLSSLNSHPISIPFVLFESTCALNFLTDFRNFIYQINYDLIKTQLGHSVHNSQEILLLLKSYLISILLRLFERTRACA